MGHELGYNLKHNNAQAGIFQYPPYRRVVQYVFKYRFPYEKVKYPRENFNYEVLRKNTLQY